MTPRRTLDAASPVRGDLYRELLEVLAPFASFAGLVVRSEHVRLAPGGLAVLARLNPCLVRGEDVTNWPGTELVGGRVSRRYLFSSTPDCVEVLIAAASQLSDWVNPSLPEDLHLLREDGTTVLGTVAQDEDAWLELEEQEFVQFEAAATEELRSAFRARG